MEDASPPSPRGASGPTEKSLGLGWGRLLITFAPSFSCSASCLCRSSSSSRWDLQVMDSFLTSLSISRHCSSLCSVSNCLKRRQSFITPFGPEWGVNVEMTKKSGQRTTGLLTCGWSLLHWGHGDVHTGQRGLPWLNGRARAQHQEGH